MAAGTGSLSSSHSLFEIAGNPEAGKGQCDKCQESYSKAWGLSTTNEGTTLPGATLTLINQSKTDLNCRNRILVVPLFKQNPSSISSGQSSFRYNQAAIPMWIKYQLELRCLFPCFLQGLLLYRLVSWKPRFCRRFEVHRPLFVDSGWTSSCCIQSTVPILAISGFRPLLWPTWPGILV